MSEPAEFTLVTLHGPEVLSLDLRPPGPYTAGRRGEHDLVLASGGTVSRDHAVFTRAEGDDGVGWMLTDLGSRHGTLLNGIPLESGRGVRLRAGDLVTIDPWTFQVKGSGRSDRQLLQTLDDATAGGTSIKRVSHTSGGGLAQERLAALLACSSAIHLAHTPQAMAAAVTEAAAAGTAFGNVAVVRPAGEGMIEVLASHGEIVTEGKPNLSRSLLEAAMEGEPVRFQRTDIVEGEAASIMQYSIEEALCVPIMLGHAAAGCLYLDNREGQVRGVGIEEDIEYCAGLAQIAALAMSNLMRVDIERRHAQERQDLLLGTIAALVAAIDAKDTYTRGHSDRVAWLAVALARALELDADTVDQLHMCGLVHDIGKIGIPEAILQKPGKLTDEEFDRIKQHPTIGESILNGVPQLRSILPGVRSHHERWDGRGYPDGLAGKDIPLFGRILGVGDAFDAMCSSRAYRDGLNRQEVLDEVDRCAGSQFDASMVERFLAIDFGEYDAMLARHVKQEPIKT